jgi:hypothetical protein
MSSSVSPTMVEIRGADFAFTIAPPMNATFMKRPSCVGTARGDNQTRP